MAKLRAKIREWAMRYVPAEIGGTFTALFASWMAYDSSGSLAVAAIAGTLGENVGYYGVIVGREGLKYWRLHTGHRNMRRAAVTAYRTTKTVVLEFGIAEALDSLLVRPGLFYLVPSLMPGHMALGFFIAKLLADAIFYSFAIAGYEYNKRFATEPLQ